MLLSRLAENIYWAGRYLERAEDTARLVKVHTELFMDLPRSVSVGWTPLLAVTGTGEAYADHLHNGKQLVGATEELRVVAFLTTAEDNASSILSCLSAARQNLRSVRAMIPRSAWEQVNQTYLGTRDSAAQATPRRSRTSWATDVIRDVQTASGIFDGTMSHDQAYAFLQIGRFLERADMTTRVLDVQAQVLLDETGEGSRAYADVTWMAVLKSVSAMQMFRRVARAGVSGSRALNFLLTDVQFPRSVAHSLAELNRRLFELPRSELAIEATSAARGRVSQADLDVHLKAMAPAELHDFMDHLQTDIGLIHDAACETWFAPQPAIALPDDPPPTVTVDRPSQTQAQTLA